MYAPIDVVVRAGVIPQLVGFLQRDENVELQVRCRFALSSYCPFHSNYFSIISSSSPSPHTLPLLTSPPSLPKPLTYSYFLLLINDGFSRYTHLCNNIDPHIKNLVLLFNIVEVVVPDCHNLFSYPSWAQYHLFIHFF